MNKKRLILDGAGWKLIDFDFEKEIWNWIHKLRVNMLLVSSKLIMFLL